ncbi:AraC family transcriptional regulator [Gilvimarinus agarilyticus]|uniref:helix-turn-helix domain-containing protein n=1 Tax=unclassified Gilvimarinus TaxID=2642066 RepID=UPI001C08FF8C|nr:MULTISPECIES: AraC family transcriptional regulator [unclassified Gilvimarinus]MBU2887851.1 AraC family transcriptional regulator [Gilvimarinus agarilyticus]MDO6572489.1 AraC family transcriptional regulator [Gilvimarinus sp. 2_MG-2023]MDO6746629.1 AraC family transcriptional regulator [Gilvimarinus sp. 1_MG-2023]
MEAYIFNFHDVIVFMTIIECIMLALFQWALPTARKTASGALIVFLLSIGLHSLCILLLWNDLVHTLDFFDLNVVPYLLMLAAFSKGQALYFYVASLTEHDFKLRKNQLVHLLPLALSWLLLLVLQIDSDALRWRADNQSQLSITVVNFIWHSSKVIPFIYGLAAVHLARRYYLSLKDQYSSFSSGEPSWLIVLTVGFLLHWIFSLVVHVGAQFSTISLSNYLGISENYVVFVLINGLFAYSAAYAHRVLTTKPVTLKTVPEDQPNDAAIVKVKNGMEVDKLFLQQNLNIEEFSNQINLPARDVSGVINKHFGTNFFEFMNSYRVEEAKRLLLDPAHKHLTILDILLQAGFNSKSAFHRFFKRLVGISPSEYRKQSAGKGER